MEKLIVIINGALQQNLSQCGRGGVTKFVTLWYFLVIGGHKDFLPIAAQFRIYLCCQVVLFSLTALALSYSRPVGRTISLTTRVAAWHIYSHVTPFQ